MNVLDPVFTLFSRRSTPDFPQQLTQALEGKLDVVKQTAETAVASQSDYFHQQIFCSGVLLELQKVHSYLCAHHHDSQYDLLIQSAQERKTKYGLACFDMDSTLIQAEVIDELAKQAGVGDQVAEITLRAMRGELDFKQSFTARMALLKGLPSSAVDKVATQLPLMHGVEEMMLGLKQRGIYTAILSGGFTHFAEMLQRRLGFDEVHANFLEFKDEHLTGEVVEPIVDGARKSLLLEQLTQQQGLQAKQTIAVGDGANDLPMINLAGLGVAFHAKPKVQTAARYSLTVPGLEGLLQLID